MEHAHAIEHADIVHRCFRCGYCKFPADYVDFNCPPHKALGWDTYSPAGRMWLVRAWMNGEIKTSPRYADILYSCVACDNCKEQCVFVKFKDLLPDIFREAKTALVDEGKIPARVTDYFKAMTVHGNPYRLPQEERGRWADGLGLPEFSGQEYLFYVGCVGSYDETGQKMARSVAGLLSAAGVSLGILGSGETCDGNEVRVLGEAGLFAQLAEQNIRLFKERHVGKVITLDPHALNAFKQLYPTLGGDFAAFHFTEILAQLVRDRRIDLAGYPAKVTFHDPCYLGRHNRIYAAPREVLRNIPGIELVEMRRSGENAFCCGGGGGNFFTDIIGPGPDSPMRVRAREALDTGAEIVAVACPQCAKMLADGLKAEQRDEDLEVVDLAEIVRRATNPRPRAN